MHREIGINLKIIKVVIFVFTLLGLLIQFSWDASATSVMKKRCNVSHQSILLKQLDDLEIPLQNILVKEFLESHKEFEKSYQNRFKLFRTPHNLVLVRKAMANVMSNYNNMKLHLVKYGYRYRLEDKELEVIEQFKQNMHNRLYEILVILETKREDAAEYIRDTSVHWPYKSQKTANTVEKESKNLAQLSQILKELP